MRIAPDLYLVASGAAGFSVTDALDCNVWLLDTGDGLALFDTGAGRDVAGLLASLAADNLDPARLRHIFLTHAHADHSGGTADLLERLSPGLTLHAGRAAAERMASNDERRISLDRARSLGVYPADYRWRGTAAAESMADATAVRIGRASITLLEAPGHSDDNCAFLVRNGDSTALIAGDAVFAGGKVIIQDIPDCNVSAMLDSIRRLAAVQFQTFLPGHGLFALRDGMSHVARARDYANTGLPPPSFF